MNPEQKKTLKRYIIAFVIGVLLLTILKAMLPHDLAGLIVGATVFTLLDRD